MWYQYSRLSCLRHIAHLNSPICSVSSPSVFGHFKGQTWLEHIAPRETDGVHLQAACYKSYQPPQQQSEDGSSEGSRPAPTGSVLLHINLHHVLADTVSICRTGRTRVQLKDVEKQQPIFTLHLFFHLNLIWSRYYSLVLLPALLGEETQRTQRIWHRRGAGEDDGTAKRPSRYIFTLLNP